MSEDSFRNTLIALVLFVGFTVLILNIAINFGEEYGRDSMEIGDGSLDLGAFQEEASGIESDAQGYRTRFESGNVDDVDDASGIFSVATDMISMITTPFSLISQILVNILGIPSIIINIVLGLLAITLILGIWRVLRAGS